MPEDESERQAVRRGRMLLLLASLFWSTSGLFLKSPPMSEGMSSEHRGPVLACYRALFAAAVLVPFVKPGAVRFRWGLVPMVAAFAAMNVLFVTAMTRTTAAAAIFLQYTSTVWGFAFAVFVLRERLDRGGLVALACALAGIVGIVWGDWGGENFAGNLIALGSGACYAGVFLSLRMLRGEDSAWLIALNHLVSGLVLLPWVLRVDVSLSPTQWVLVALLGSTQMALPYVLFARGVRTVGTQEAALLLLLEPVLNPLWVWLVWGERVPLTTIVGGGLIIGGLAARYLLFPPATPAASPAEQPADAE